MTKAPENLFKWPARYPTTWHEFPPSHNPLINTTIYGTLENLKDVVSLIDELLFRHNFDEKMQQPNLNDFRLPDTAASGLYLVLECASKALEFELAHRERATAD
jgi:hypothetical protein